MILKKQGLIFLQGWNKACIRTVLTWLLRLSSLPRYSLKCSTENLGYFYNQETSGLHSRREQEGTEVGTAAAVRTGRRAGRAVSWPELPWVVPVRRGYWSDEAIGLDRGGEQTRRRCLSKAWLQGFMPNEVATFLFSRNCKSLWMLFSPLPSPGACFHFISLGFAAGLMGWVFGLFPSSLLQALKGSTCPHWEEAWLEDFFLSHWRVCTTAGGDWGRIRECPQ